MVSSLKDSMKERPLICECGIILKTGDELYNHIYKTNHKIGYKVEDSHLIEQKLSQWKVELEAAVSMLNGRYLAEFKELIAHVANLCNLNGSDTGTFIKPDV